MDQVRSSWVWSLMSVCSTEETEIVETRKKTGKHGKVVHIKWYSTSYGKRNKYFIVIFVILHGKKAQPSFLRPGFGHSETLPKCSEEVKLIEYDSLS